MLPLKGSADNATRTRARTQSPNRGARGEHDAPGGWRRNDDGVGADGMDENSFSPSRCLHLLGLLRSNLSFPPVRILPFNHPRNCRHGNQRLTPFPPSSAGRDRGGLNSEERARLIEGLARSIPHMDGAMGCVAGMAVGDAAGAPLEFLPATDPPRVGGGERRGEGTNAFSFLLGYGRGEQQRDMVVSRFRASTGEYVDPLNAFMLEDGQWTDDAAMGLCLADSILCHRNKRRQQVGGADGAEKEAGGRKSTQGGSGDDDSEYNEKRMETSEGGDESGGQLNRGEREEGGASEEATAEEDCPPATQEDRISVAFDGSDARLRFWTWWNTGYNNAFRLDPEPRASVGLGGNISKSIYSMQIGVPVSPRYESTSEDAGNGSLMRLGPVPAAFHRDIALARDVAEASSYATHPGPIAAEACRFLAHVVVRAINRREAAVEKEKEEVVLLEEEEVMEEEGKAGKELPLREKSHEADDKGSDGPPEKKKGRWDLRPKTRKTEAKDQDVSPAAAFLVEVADEYICDVLPSRPKSPQVDLLRRLLLSSEPDTSLERCWNWRSPPTVGLDVRGTLERRGPFYNGYHNRSEYFGSYSLDGLAVALHAFRSTDTFDGAIERCVNFRGDADSTSAICGQIAGAYYGWGGIGSRFKRNLRRWDDGEVALRGALLAQSGQPDRCLR